MFYMDEQTQRAIKKFPHRAADIAQSYDAKQIKCKEWLHKKLEYLPAKSKRIYIDTSRRGSPVMGMRLYIIEECTRFL